MNHTDAHGTGHRRRLLESRSQGHALDRTPVVSTRPARSRTDRKDIVMYGLIDEQLARQRHREICLEARRARLVRAVRARQRALRAAELAARAVERAGAEPAHPGARRVAGASLADG